MIALASFLDLDQWWPTLTFVAVVLGELLAILVVFRILLSGGSPAGTLNWIIIILVAPFLGLVLYYLMPRRMQRRLLRQRTMRRSGTPSPVGFLWSPHSFR